MFDIPFLVDRLEKEVVALEQRPIETGKIIFYGDSGFTRWGASHKMRPLEEEIRMKNGDSAVLNHGIGGCTAEELLYYYPRLVKAWKPSALVSMAFCNDRDYAYSPEEMLHLQARMFDYARRDLPGIRFFLCDVRPITKDYGDTGWRAFKSNVLKYNELVRIYCESHEDCTLVKHIDSPLFFENPADVGDYDKVRRDIFVEDEVHFNQKGYDLYGTFFRDVLRDLL